jgi:hypothetical protein
MFRQRLLFTSLGLMFLLLAVGVFYIAGKVGRVVPGRAMDTVPIFLEYP